MITPFFRFFFSKEKSSKILISIKLQKINQYFEETKKLFTPTLTMNKTYNFIKNFKTDTKIQTIDLFKKKTIVSLLIKFQLFSPTLKWRIYVNPVSLPRETNFKS